MTIFEFKQDSIEALKATTFGKEGLGERSDIQRLLRDHLEVVSPDLMVISEEFGDWNDSRRRIDLLALDRDANLVVVELKRDEVGGHMELQAIRYAAMVSQMTFEQVVTAHGTYLGKREIARDARSAVLEFLDWAEPDEELFAQSVRIVLCSADFSKEVTTAVMWLNDHDLDIRCVRLKPYRHGDTVLVDVQQVIPLPEALEYQIQVREKTRQERSARQGAQKHKKYDVSVNGVVYRNLGKGRAILTLVRGLCNAGVDPDAVKDIVFWRKNRIWRSVKGAVDASEFARLAALDADAGGPAYDSKRWFCGDDQLVSWEGNTFAFSSQWGHRTVEAMELLSTKFSDKDVSYSISGGETP